MTEEAKPNRKKFKYTKELVKIALDEGMTQKQIGDLCRVEQSIVSGWAKGKSALEKTIEPLRKKYGARLNRTAAKVYLVGTLEPPKELFAQREACEKELEEFDKQRPTPPPGLNLDLFAAYPHLSAKAQEILDEKEDVKIFLEKLCTFQEERQAIKSKIPFVYSMSDSFVSRTGVEREALVFQEEFGGQPWPPKLARVEGPIVFRYSFCLSDLVATGKADKLIRVPVGRWLLHRQTDDRFFLVIQKRRFLNEEGVERWRKSLSDDSRKRPTTNFFWLESRDEAAQWLSQIEGPFASTALIEWVDAYIKKTDTLHNPHDEMVLPFLIRKTLVEQGYTVEGVLHVGGQEE